MGRAKIWGFTLLVLAAGAVNLFAVTQGASERTLEQAGATLKAGVAQLDAAGKLLARQASGVAALAARDPALVAALSKPPGTGRSSGRGAPQPAPPEEVVALAEAALRAAAQALEVDASQAIVAANAGEAASLQAGDRKITGTEAVAKAVLGDARGGRHVRLDDSIYYVATTPVARGVTVAFGLPLDARWLERIKAATGADVTLSAGAKSPSTLPGADVAGVLGAAKRGGGAAVDIGRLGPVKLPFGGAPAVPILFARAPAWRARALPLAGLEGAPAVVSVSMRALLEPVGVYQQVSIAVLGVLLLVGAILGALPERAVTAHVPRELASAADRIARGDYDVRVPRMSGTFGALAAALNRAADAARAGRGSAAPLAPPVPAYTLDVPLMAVAPQEGPLPAAVLDDPFAAGGMAAPGPSAPAHGPTPRNGTEPSRLTPLPTMPAQRTGTARFEAAEPLAAQTPFRAPAPPPRPAQPAVPLTDDDQWQSVFQEFLKVREQCGESLDGLTWDRFRQKLQKNKDSLVQKYACRTVRFQVYVKEGKAALKATPVR